MNVLTSLYLWAFVLTLCVLAALFPSLCRHYSRLRWRIPLWHAFVAVAVVGLVICLAVGFVRSVHDLDEWYYRWFTKVSNPDPADVPYTPTLRVMQELAFRGLVPAVVVLILSTAVTVYYPRYAKLKHADDEQ